MNQDEEIEYVEDFGPIPPIFYSDLTKAPFDKCTMCNRALMEEGVPYIIEKAFRVNKEFKVKETVFEYAICWDCGDNMKDAMSEESMQKLTEYFHRHAKLMERRHQLLRQKSTPQIEQWIGKCIFKGTPMNELDEYQIFGQFDGEHILYHETPYLICGEAIHEMTEMLSQKTRDEMDRFLDEYTGLPPELKKALQDGQLVFI